MCMDVTKDRSGDRLRYLPSAVIRGSRAVEDCKADSHYQLEAEDVH